MSKVNFLGYDCIVKKEQYRANGQIALQLFVADTPHNVSNGFMPGEPMTTATVCLKGERFETGETAIKDYSENEGILCALINANIVQLTERTIKTGFVEVPIVKVLI